MSEHLTVRQLKHATQQTQQWLKELAGREPLGSESRAYTFLRAVLHAVRDRMPVEEAAHLGQQLPMMVRGFYYEGWQPSRAPNEIDTRAEFLEHVESSLGGSPTGSGDLDVEAGTTAVLEFLGERLQEGTWRHVTQQLPEDVRSLFPAGAG